MQSTDLRLADNNTYSSSLRISVSAGVAQLAEHLICNQGVAGSTPVTSSKRMSAGLTTDINYKDS